MSQTKVPQDTTIVSARIHPAIGIARVGNSPEEYFIGPEVVTPVPTPPGGFQDSTGALKRQAALFRIYGYNAFGEPVRELTADEAEITWTSHVANTKSEWFEFQLALDIPEAAEAPASKPRNADIKDRNRLIIDPGARSICGKNQQGDEYKFDSGSFMGKQVYLGELRTDNAGRLIFLGGHGKSASYDGSKATTFANNDKWHDDVSDGPVTASVKLDGKELQVEGAWVIVAPPNYGPSQVSVRTIYDLLVDVYVQSGALPVPTRASFTKDILPVLQRLSNLQWVNKGFEPQYGKGAPWDFNDPGLLHQLNEPGDTFRELRRQVTNMFRVFARDGASPVPWPWLYGDAMAVPPAKTPRQHVMISPTQVLLFNLWAEGNFESDYNPQAKPVLELRQVEPMDQPAMLDEAALTHCLADAFHPGCEMTWPVRHATMYSAPFRIRHRDPATNPVPDYGSQLTPQVATSLRGPLHAQSPGDITRWMAVPWQTDTASCRSGYYAGYGPKYDPYLPTFWPARVPNQVLTLANYKKVLNTDLSREERLAAYQTRASWFRRLGVGYIEQINDMIDNFWKQGIVEVRPGVEDDPDFPAEMQVESAEPTGRPEVPLMRGLVVAHKETGELSGDELEALAVEAEAAVEDIVVGNIEKIHRFEDEVRYFE